MLWPHANISKVLGQRGGEGPSPPVDPHEPEYNGEFRRVCAGEYNESCFEGIAIRCFFIYYLLIIYCYPTRFVYVHIRSSPLKSKQIHCLVTVLHFNIFTRKKFRN